MIINHVLCLSLHLKGAMLLNTLMIIALERQLVTAFIIESSEIITIPSMPKFLEQNQPSKMLTDL